MAWTMLVVTTSGWFAWLGVALSVKNSAQLWRAGTHQGRSELTAR